jgi:acyl-CoA dehydrogenase
MAEISIEDFTAEVEAFLSAHATRRPPRTEFRWGEGNDEVSLFAEKDPVAEREEIARAKDWRAKRFAAGLGWIEGPEEYGGRALSKAHERAYAAAESRYETPGMGIFTISLGMVAPTIHAHGTAALKEAYLQRLYRGDLVGCQLFSEPGAGSDLAGVQCRAERDGDEWIVNGQKVWTSNAQYADIGEVICRTDPDQPKHRGLTMFIVDMNAPGVEVRPLRQMTGGATFNEVFFTDVRIPDSHRLDEVNNGWAVALTTLMNERAAIGGGGIGGGELFGPRRVRMMLEAFDKADDRVLIDEYCRIYSAMQVARWNNQRALDKIRAGAMPGPELSTAKLALTEGLKDFANWTAAVLGPRITADSGEWGTFGWAKLILGVPGMRVAGGTDEVMRNIIAERVLGLPKDPGVDSKTPFRDLPH